MRIRAAILGTAMAAWGAEDYSAWGHSRDLMVDASPSGANLGTDLAGYPLCVAFGSESAELFSQARTDGRDLRFASSDGSHLAYEIESWDAASHRGAVWVRLPLIKAGAVSALRAYWGMASAADSSGGPSVFRADDGFRGVWHMGSMADASGGNAAKDSGTTAEAGRIGGARAFANSDAYATKGAYMALGNPAALDIKGAITMEAWVKWGRRDGHRIIVCHGAAPGSEPETVLRIGEAKDYRTGVWTGASHHATAEAPAADSNTWVHLAGVCTGSGWILYRDGARFAATAADTNGAKPSPGGWRIGAQFSGGNISRYYAGAIDEVRIQSAARGADWVKMDYATQREGQTVVRWAEASKLFIAPEARKTRARPSWSGLFNILGVHLRVP